MYLDRRDAGRRLAERLLHLREERPVVVALPRGGVPVADEIATALAAPLLVLPARKLGAPGNPEFAVGAIAPGVVYLDPLVDALGIPRSYLEWVIATEQAEVERREREYRAESEPCDVAGRTAILVDDGLATGATAMAAIESLRRRTPAAIILAVPVAARDSLASLARQVDAVVCPEVPEVFRAVGDHYADFRPTPEEEVTEILRRRRF